MPAVAVPPVPSAYATVTCRPLAGLSVTVKVRFAEPLFPSVTLGESIDSVGAPSSSVIVSVTDDGCVIPCELVAEPDTVTLLSASSRALSTAVTVTVPLLLVAPAAMVSVVLLLRLKSPFAVFAPAAAETVTVVCWLDARSRLAVTVAELVAPLSAIDVRDSASVTVGVASSSVIVSVTAAGCVIPWLLVAEPDTVTLLSASSVELSTAVTVTDPVLLVLPAAMVSVVLLLSEKSPAAAFAPGAAETVMVVAADEGRSRLAVTVAELVAPLSAIEVRDSASVTVGAASSSVIVSVTAAGCVIPWLLVAEPDTVTLLLASSRVLSTAVTVTVPLLLVLPAAMVSVVLLLSAKSVSAVAAPAAAATVMVVAADDARSRLAVTVAELVAPLSAIELRDSARVTVGASSSSVIVPVPVPAVLDTVALVGLLSATTTVSFGSSVVSPVTETVTVLLVSPAANVSIPPLSAV